MKTEIVSKSSVDHLAKTLLEEEVVAFPTETVYGLGIVYDSRRAMEKLKWAKQRPESKPFTLMVADPRDIERFAKTTKRDRAIIAAWMPGPLTVILPKREDIPDWITNGYATIGIRCPADSFVRDLIRKVGKPLLVPSANISGEPAAKNDQEVLAAMDGRIALIVEGKCQSGQASTILDLCKKDIQVLRQGELTLTKIKEGLEKNEGCDGM